MKMFSTEHIQRSTFNTRASVFNKARFESEHEDEIRPHPNPPAGEGMAVGRALIDLRAVGCGASPEEGADRAGDNEGHQKYSQCVGPNQRCRDCAEVPDFGQRRQDFPHANEHGNQGHYNQDGLLHLVSFDSVI